MNRDDWADLMEEPPGGENHGRVRTGHGWRSLEPRYDHDLPYIVTDPDARPRTDARHGTRARYVNQGCRCDDCRRANREYMRRRRAG